MVLLVAAVTRVALPQAISWPASVMTWVSMFTDLIRLMPRALMLSVFQRGWSAPGTGLRPSWSSIPAVGCTSDDELMAELVAVKEAVILPTRCCWLPMR